MNDLITHVKGVLETTYPSYELVVSEVHDYYNLPFSTFACKDNTLIIYISFYIKPINQELLYMYEITNIPVPYHMNDKLIDETESKYTYINIKPTTEILAMGRSSQINLNYNDLVHCIQMSNQAVTLFAPVGVAEDLSKTQHFLCGEIKQELKLLKESITAIPFQEITEQIQQLASNLEV